MKNLLAAALLIVFTFANAASDFSPRKAGGSGQFDFINYYSRWPGAVIPWYYNPAQQLAAFGQTAILAMMGTIDSGAG